MPEVPAYMIAAAVILLLWFAAAATYAIFAWFIKFIIHAFIVIFKFIVIGFLLGALTMYYADHYNSWDDVSKYLQSFNQEKGRI